ncbi:hypothetical protein EJB05_51714 [Eragrostis curvula]|uniref:Uncharacterized protein n=1 Tax=Eragrostis curvula TaxID=38414 RepID=A0A5J9SUZ2_9POAL|nr:hypothetical protein EJB05_51714 [Eragrostis curvula]
MDPVKSGEPKKDNRAEQVARLKELKLELNKIKADRSLSGAKVTDGSSNKLSEIEELRAATAPFLREALQKQEAALREARNKKREPFNIRPCFAAAAPPDIIINNIIVTKIRTGTVGSKEEKGEISLKTAREMKHKNYYYMRKYDKGLALGKKKKEKTETYTICLEDTSVSKIHAVEGCAHRFCFSYMKEHVKSKLLNGKLPAGDGSSCFTEQFPPIDLLEQNLRSPATWPSLPHRHPRGAPGDPAGTPPPPPPPPRLHLRFPLRRRSRRPRFTPRPHLPRRRRRPCFLPIAIPVDLRLILPVYSPSPSAIHPTSLFPPSSFSPAASLLPHRHPRFNLMDEPDPNTPADVTRWNSERRKLDKIPSHTTVVAFMNSQEYYAVPILPQNQPNSESLAGHNIQSIEQGPRVRYEHPSIQNPRHPASRPQPRRTEPDLDDDDFVNPPTTSSRARKRTAEASTGCRNVCRRSESVINQEKTNNVKKGKLLSRCTPKDLLQAITSLNDPQKKKIDDLHWGDFLSIKIDAVESRDLYCWLLDRVDTSTMTLVISPDKVLPLSPVSVHNVMALPMGGGDLPKVRSKLVTEARKLLCSSLSLDSRTITIKRLLQEVAKGHIDDLSMKCFCKRSPRGISMTHTYPFKV